jgi:hypothetical protein
MINFLKCRKIAKKLFEAEARMELALHYKNPYPKHYNLTKMATPETIASAPGVYMKSAYMVRLLTSVEACKSTQISQLTCFSLQTGLLLR